MKQAPNLSADLFDDAPTKQRPKLADEPESFDFMRDLEDDEPSIKRAPPPPPTRAKP